MDRIIKKTIAVNNKYDLRIVYVVDGWLYCSTRAKAEQWISKYVTERCLK